MGGAADSNTTLISHCLRFCWPSAKDITSCEELSSQGKRKQPNLHIFLKCYCWEVLITKCIVCGFYCSGVYKTFRILLVDIVYSETSLTRPRRSHVNGEPRYDCTWSAINRLEKVHVLGPVIAPAAEDAASAPSNTNSPQRCTFSFLIVVAFTTTKKKKSDTKFCRLSGDHLCLDFSAQEKGNQWTDTASSVGSASGIALVSKLRSVGTVCSSYTCRVTECWPNLGLVSCMERTSVINFLNSAQLV